MTQEHIVALDICIWAALDLEFLHDFNFPLKTQMVQLPQTGLQAPLSFIPAENPVSTGKLYFIICWGVMLSGLCSW